MATATAPAVTKNLLESKISKKPGRIGTLLFGVVLLIGAIYSGWHLISDLSNVHPSSATPFLLLGVALTIALGFEFVNGFHDTANAVATVIYTHTLEPHVAVVWSGVWNFIGVLTSTGAVAFGIISLLPVGLILQAGSKAGFAMIFALLVSAILWNLGTWYFGLPNSSSHTLIGSVLGVGLINQFLEARNGVNGVDWDQASSVGKSLLLSPLVGFVCSGLLFLLSKALIKNPKLYSEPKGAEPPPFWIRGLLMLTCTGVSFAHGSNDGQKGMGLIMLILVGTVPTAYALNRAVGYGEVQNFIAVSERVERILGKYTQSAEANNPTQARAEAQRFISSQKIEPGTVSALQALVGSVQKQVANYKTYALIPIALTGNVRNDMYLASETLRVMEKKQTPAFQAEENSSLLNYKTELDRATKFIPDWVKVAVALALGLGTMVGWKRIVVTVGEKIGKQHLTYAQGAASELVAMSTILAADRFGLPVSTTHVLTSGVAGTMAANHAGLQWATIRNLALAWVLTLPASIAIAASLYWLFRHLS